MVRPPDSEIHHLKAIAQEMSEIGDESGYLVGVATDQHASFRRTRRPASALARELFVDAARRAASREGFAIDEVSGGVDLITSGGGHLRKYRVKRGTRTADGAYRFVCGLGSSLLTSEIDALFVEERWLLGYISSEDNTLDEIVAAEVVGSEGNGPVTLLLGAVIPLIDMAPPPNFTSTDEGLDGFEGDEGTEDGSAGIA